MKWGNSQSLTSQWWRTRATKVREGTWTGTTVGVMEKQAATYAAPPPSPFQQPFSRCQVDDRETSEEGDNCGGHGEAGGNLCRTTSLALQQPSPQVMTEPGERPGPGRVGM